MNKILFSGSHAATGVVDRTQDRDRNTLKSLTEFKKIFSIFIFYRKVFDYKFHNDSLFFNFQIYSIKNKFYKKIFLILNLKIMSVRKNSMMNDIKKRLRKLKN